MSKAFTKESDVELEEPPVRVSDLLPDGATNYLTPDGARRMREELRALTSTSFPGEETSAATQEKRHRDRRLRELQTMLHGAEVVPPPDDASGTVQFGALVTVRESSGDEFPYRIVGVHETDLTRGWISWRSPIAKALLNAQVGDTVRFDAPVGELRLEIVKVEYPDTHQ
jgi:transcription elongation factor GreB